MSDQNHNSLYENSEYPSRKRSTQRGGDRRPRKKHRGGAGSTIFKVLGTLLLVGLCTGAILCCFTAVYIKEVIVPIADLSEDDFVIGENSIMYYTDKATGQDKELTTLLSTTSSLWVDYDEIPQDLKDAAVAIEDKRFYKHPGVDWRRTAKAVLDMFTGNDISGGSTITQQLIKNMTDYNETTVKRKVTEIVRAIRFTKDPNNSKDNTLCWYLNIIPLGSRCEGVGSASYAYFGKPVSELSLAECASLISITNNPSKYGPYSPAKMKSPDGTEVWTAIQWNKYRQETVLYQMLDQEMITKEEYDAAVAEELVFVRGEGEKAPQEVYSWYEETVISDVKRDLREKKGWSDTKIEQMLARGGLRIYTCLDPEVQKIAEKIYNDRANLNYVSGRGQDMQSSITIIDNTTGDVAAIVGQFGKKEGNLWTNYANTAQRQPGSSFKPLAVYAPALDMDLISPITVLDDYPYNDSKPGGWPTNSGAARYKGLTTIRQGLTHSVNTISVRVIADLVTPQQSFDFVQDKFKIDLVEAMESGNTIKSDIDVAPMSMGGLTKGVCTRDMAEAYATFPNNGVYTYSRTYTKVLDRDGNVILDNQPQQEPVIKDTTAYYMNSMLQNVITSGTAKGHGIGITAAGKTGTTSENNDRWFVGYTPYYTAAVWTGYPVNEKMKTSGNPALNLWEKVMEEVHAGLPDKKFPEPGGLKSPKFCLDSGALATEYCSMDPRGSRVSSDRVFQADAPTTNCTAHTADSVVKVCLDCPVLDANGKETGLYYLAGPYCPEDRQKEVCLPKYDRDPVSTAVAADEMYRYWAAQERGTCTVHTQAPVEEPDPWNPFEPWWPSGPDGNGGDQPTTDPVDPDGNGGTGEEPPSQDVQG